MAKMVLEEISSDVGSSEVFSLSADECRDAAKQEQLAITVRFFSDKTTKTEEVFVGYVALTELDAKTLAESIQKALASIGINVQCCVGQCYDGASVVKGSKGGVQKLIRDIVHHAIYVHCYAHRLNLVIGDTLKQTVDAAQFFSLAQSLYSFISQAAVHSQFLEVQRACYPGQQPMELKRQCETRFIYGADMCKALKKTHLAIVLLLSSVASDKTPRNSDRAVEARGLLAQLDLKYLLMLILQSSLMMTLKILSEQLQAVKLEFTGAVRLVKVAKDDIESLLDGWEEMIDEAKKLMAEVTDAEARAGKKITRSGDASEEDLLNLCKDSFAKMIEIAVDEISIRFSDENVSILLALSACDPLSDNFMNIDSLSIIASHYSSVIYSDDSDFDDVKSQAKTVMRLLKEEQHKGNYDKMPKSATDLLKYLKPFQQSLRLIYKVVKIVVTLPVSSASCERSFSTMSRIKTYTRTKMADNRLSNLAVLSMNSERAKNLDLEEVLRRYYKLHPNMRLPLF